MNSKNIFTTPSFQKGVARVMDLQAGLDQYLQQSDAQALQSDWESVGKDIEVAIIHYEKESGRTKGN